MTSTKGTTSKAYSSLAPFINDAAVTLVNAIMEATDRSMPPAMTTMVCAATAKAKGRTARASEPKSPEP